VQGQTYIVPDHEYGLSQRGSYSQCAHCGTLSQSPMPSFQELASFYPTAYHSFHNRTLMVRAKNALRLKRLRSMVSGDGAILDYGCGDGSFMVEAAGSLPNQMVGYEIAGEYEERTLANGRVVIIRGKPEDLFRSLPACQLITMNHVIEHLPSPIETISQLVRCLAPGGRLEGQTPAADSLERDVFGERWSGFHSPRHTVIFSRLGLKTLLARAGLNDAEVTGGFNPAGIAVSVATLRQKANAPGRISRSGIPWLISLAIATGVYPIDLLSGRPGIINFSGRN
jgi:SAM-dependent methyltransferase